MQLIRQAKIIDSNSPYNGQTVDVLVRNGSIEQISKKISIQDAEEITGKDLVLTPGWFDTGTFIGDPGYEHREDMASASKAACRGGFTALACWPNTLPTLDNKSSVQYIVQNGSRFLPTIYPIAALSMGCQGRDITEMYDMRNAGAIAYSDGLKSVQDSGLMMRALLYVKPFDGVIVQQALDLHMAPDGQVHEGPVSTAMGLTGIPSLAEEVMVQRDLLLTEYTGSTIHFANITCAGSVDRIRSAKKNGIRVTASVPIMNLLYTDKLVETFDANYKVFPPLRDETDRIALIEGVLDGTIDIINSNHMPWEEEVKDREFSESRFGTINLETAAAQSWSELAEAFGAELLVRCWSTRPREIFGLEIPVIKDGVEADIAVFDRGVLWTVKTAEIASRSKNSHLIGKELSVRTVAVFHNKQHWILS